MKFSRRGAVLALVWFCASGAGAAVIETAPVALPVGVVPVAPAEIAAKMLLDAVSILPQTHVPGLDALAIAVPARAPAIAKTVTPESAAKIVAAALPLLKQAAPLAEMKPDESAAFLAKLYGELRAQGLVEEPAPAVELHEAAARTGLDKSQLDLIRKHSKGLLPVETFLQKTPLGGGGYLLGATDRSVYPMLASATGLTHFAEVYQELYGRTLMDATDRFLDFITGRPDAVVFLLPPQVLTHPQSVVTKSELLWFFAHPERMENVRFVLGAYEFLGGNPEGERREQAARALELWRGEHGRSPDERRLEQRRRHRASRGEAEPLRPSGAQRLADIESFIDDMSHAYYGKDRGSTGRFYFQGSRGTCSLHRSERGLFLEYTVPGGGWAEIFVSKRGEPELYERLWRAYLDAS